MFFLVFDLYSASLLICEWTSIPSTASRVGARYHETGDLKYLARSGRSKIKRFLLTLQVNLYTTT